MSFRGVRSEKRWAFAGNLYLKLLLDLEDGGHATGVRRYAGRSEGVVANLLRSHAAFFHLTTVGGSHQVAGQLHVAAGMGGDFEP